MAADMEIIEKHGGKKRSVQRKMDLNSSLLGKLEEEIKQGGIARFSTGMAVREIEMKQLYKPTYTSIFEYMKSVFKWERRKTKLVLYDANIYAVLKEAFSDQPWKLPRFRNQLKGINTTYQELIPAIWTQVNLLGPLPETQRLESTRTIQKRLEDEYNNSQYVNYMSFIYSKNRESDLEELIAIIQNQLDPIKLAITLYFIDHAQNSVTGGIHGIKLHAAVGKLKQWGRDRVKGFGFDLI
jgi:hypothetical protein